MTRGHKSSERKACYLAFYFGVVMAIYGVYKGADLTALAILIPAVSTPLLWYAGARSLIKAKNGESEND